MTWKPRNLVEFIRRQPAWRLVVAGVMLLGGLVWLLFPGGRDASTAPTFAARRGPLEITVLEGGSLQALESQEVKCQVRVGHQGTKILRIVDEGYLVTDDDVKNKKVLVELDSSDLEQQIIQQEIQYQSALASLIDAQQSYEIQLRQNLSDVLSAEQKVRFARMDFDKFLGGNVTAKVVAECGLEAMLAATETNQLEEAASPEMPEQRRDPRNKAPGISPIPTNGTPGIVPAVLRTISDTTVSEPVKRETKDTVEEEIVSPRAQIADVNFSKYADITLLGDGEAKQKLRKFEDDLQVARKELGQATTMLEGTKRLFEKGYVTRNDMQRDDISYENSRLKVQTAETAQDLYKRYDFLKQAEQSLSTYADAVRDMDKARRVAVSKQAQSKARLRSAQGQFEIQSRQRKENKEQLERCIIVAERPGLVVYGGGREEYYGGEERVREGATVRERQSIITIPDTSRMCVNVKVHESYVNKVRKGQKARITVDAFPDVVLTGEVSKVAVLPDSQNRWMNPDMKIYNTTVAIDGSQDWAKPGMSAKVEILVSEIKDCVYVPLQAVTTLGEKQVCYMASGAGSAARELKVGQFNDNFIQILSGLKEGEKVLLRAPSGAQSETEGQPDAPKPSPEQPVKKSKERPATKTAKT